MTGKDTIYITEFDLKRLKALIKHAKESWGKRIVPHIVELDEELGRAEIVEPEAVPRDVITMNSRFRLSDLETGEEKIYTLVFPGSADSSDGKISILAPLGTAVLGYRVGDIVEWKMPGGFRRFIIKSLLYQPEAALNYSY